MRTWKVGILLFDEVEVLDFAGPFEVFSVTRAEYGDGRPFDVYTVAQEKRLIKARNGLRVEPRCSFEDAPTFDILIVPGGYGAEEIEIHNRVLLDWLRGRAAEVTIMASVCTGAFLLAEAGLLGGRRVTTHWTGLDKLEREYSLVTVERNVRFVDEGNIVTAAGISAGIDMCLHLVERLMGAEVARATAKLMEYAPQT